MMSRSMVQVSKGNCAVFLEPFLWTVADLQIRGCNKICTCRSSYAKENCDILIVNRFKHVFAGA